MFPDWYVRIVNNPQAGYNVLIAFCFVFGLAFHFCTLPRSKDKR